MEKNTKPIVDPKAVASKAVAAKAVDSVLDAVPGTDNAAGASVAAGGGRIPPVWDPYEEEPYIQPANPYDTSLADPWSELDSSDVGSDDEHRDTKARQVLRRLQTGKYDSYFANEVYRCPFCKRRLASTDFNCLVSHAEGISSGIPRVGQTVNVHAFSAKHQALGIHLRNIQQVAIAAGRMAPIKPKVPKIKGQRSNKWMKRQMA